MGKKYRLTFSLVDGSVKSVEFEVPSGSDGKTAYEYAVDGGYTGTEEDFAKKMAQDVIGITETDPTVPKWAKEPTKPTYTKNDVGLGNVEDVRQYSENNVPPYPVTSVNGKTGAVSLSAADVGARPANWMPSAEDVGALPATYTPPNQTAEQVGADPKGTAAAAVAGHNTSTDAHGDIRQELQALTARLNAFFDSDDQTLDELSEIVAYITSNKGLIDAITTSKVSVADIIDNLTTNVANKPLSAAQGAVLKGLIDTLTSNLSNYALKSAIPTKVSQLQNDSKYLTQHQDISHLLPRTELPTAINTALAQAKASGEFDGYTPQIGVDYWTSADQEAIVQQVILALGTPVFGTVGADKKITLTTDNLVDGTYELGYEDKDGKWVKIGDYVKGAAPAPVVELVWTDSLKLDKTTGAESTDSSYFASDYISLVSGYTYTVGRTQAQSQFKVEVMYFTADKSVLSVVEAWGNTVGDREPKSYVLEPPSNAAYFRLRGYDGAMDTLAITTPTIYVDVAKDEEPSYTNQLNNAINADGTPYNNGKGWKSGYRINSSGTETAASNIEVIGFIPFALGDVAYFKNISLLLGNSAAQFNNQYLAFYNESFSMIGTTKFSDAMLSSQKTTYTADASNNLMSFTFDSGIFEYMGVLNELAAATKLYFRISAEEIDDSSIITLNEPIE